MRFLFAFWLIPLVALQAQPVIKIAKLKYNGGGDWYANKTALPNLVEFCNKELGTTIQIDDEVAEAGSTDIYNYPYVYMTGHGNVVFSADDARNLRNYLISGGFLHIDDNYGLDKFIRLELKKVFPELELTEVPYSHAIYHQKFNFPAGLPKIHEHDGKPAQGFGLFYEGRLVVFYSYECDLGNGWEDQRIHNVPAEKRQQALQMGANILSYCFTTN
ncbi:MAG: transmembrane prediction [Bacteroidetes bacterium OLB12]|nr:MAG: transmembrane prediction [Bacteroidetes bacterium OLB12]